MANEVVIRITAKDDTAGAFDKTEKRANDWAARLRQMLTRLADWVSNQWRDMFGRAGHNAGEKLADGLWRSADGRLRDMRGRFAKMGDDTGGIIAGSFVAMFMRVAGGLADGMATVLMGLFKGGIGGAASAAASGPYAMVAAALLAIVAAAAAAAAALLALAPVVLLVGGTVGAASMAIFGLAGAVATLMMGFGGLGDAWTAFSQKSAGGGRSAAAAAREVKAATDALADAQRAALKAQQDVSRAREEETERLEDLSRSLAEAHLDEEGAVLALARARQRMSQARRSRDGLDFTEASLGVRQAEASLARIRDRVGDLAKEKEEADRKGVEGSDRVQAALERQMLTERQLAEATQRLTDAQSGGAGGVDKFAEAMANLSVNGQKLIQTLIALKPQFGELRRSVQDRLLSGFDVTLKDLAEKWLPVLGPMLGRLADSLNRILKGFAGAFSKPQFISDMQHALGGFGGVMERLGQGVEALIGGLGRLARASTPFFLKLADLVAGTFENFEAWIAEADRTGKLDQFMEDAAKNLESIWRIGGLVKDIFGEIIEIFLPGSQREGETFFGGLELMLTGFRDWLADESNQQKIREWISDVQDFGDSVVEAFEKVKGWIDKIDEWITTMEIFLALLRDMKDRIKEAASGMFDGLKDAFKSALNWIIDKWNGLEFPAPTGIVGGLLFGGRGIGTPDIARLAHGGIGGGLAEVAERGRELIRTPDGGMLLAMPHGSTVYPNGTTESMLGRGGGGGTTTVQIDIQGTDDDFRRRIQKLVNVFGNGNVQLAFGRASAAT